MSDETQLEFYTVEVKEGLVQMTCPTCLTITHQPLKWYLSEYAGANVRCEICGTRAACPEIEVAAEAIEEKYEFIPFEDVQEDDDEDEDEDA